jgi:uncharacterized protein YbjT (DUF2867 family)
MDEKIRVILTGATGMIGEGVLYECLNHPLVEQVLVVNRRPCEVKHSKLIEIIHSDFFELASIEEPLRGYNSCFFCLGVSSVGMSESEYFRLTHSLTLTFAETLARLNPAMTFCYISGKSTDSSEKGSLAWARIKGKTENDLMKLGFQKAYAFRPGFIKPTKGFKNTLKPYRYLGWLYPLLKRISPNYACTLREIGLAMIHSVTIGYDKNILEVRDIIDTELPIKIRNPV